MSRTFARVQAATAGTGGRSRLDVMTFALHGDTQPRNFDVFRFRAAAGVLPVDEEGNVYLIEEFAPGAEGWVTGLARGGIEPGETPEQAAQRELREEAGLTCESFEPLWEGLVAANVSDWKVYLFLARDVRVVGREGGDEGGEVGLRKLPLREAVAMVKRGELPTALTALAVMLAADRLPECMV